MLSLEDVQPLYLERVDRTGLPSSSLTHPSGDHVNYTGCEKKMVRRCFKIGLEAEQCLVELRCALSNIKKSVHVAVESQMHLRRQVRR